jgi:hypothetical protein
MQKQIVFFCYASNSWGKGLTLTEALTNLKKNHSSSLEGKLKEYALAIYEAENIDNIYMGHTDIAINRGEHDKQIYHKVEKI